jgi:hypothetical protein
MVDALSLFSINNLLTTSFHKRALSPTKTNTDLVSFLFLFRAEVNEKEKLTQS